MARTKRPEGQLSQDEVDAVTCRPITFVSMAKIIGITASALRQSAIEFREDMTFGDMIRAIHEKRRNEASGHTGELAEERAKLAAAQRERIEMELALKRQEIAPISVLSKALSDAVSVSVQTLEAVPGRVKMRDPSFTPSQILLLEEEIAKARNAIAAAEIEIEE